MIVGGHKTGKTSTLHSWGAYCGYDCVRVLSPGKMVGMDPSKKMNLMFKIFSEGNSSKKSVIIVDDLDIILEYTEYGCRVQNGILHDFYSHMKNQKQGNKMIILVSSSDRLDPLKVRD